MKQVKYDPAIHHRRSIRLRGHDYAGRGVYFVTLRTSDFRPLFGTVVGGRMALNDAGRAAAACWRAIPEHFPHAALDEWIPIVWIMARGIPVRLPPYLQHAVDNVALLTAFWGGLPGRLRPVMNRR